MADSAIRFNRSASICWPEWPLITVLSTCQALNAIFGMPFARIRPSFAGFAAISAHRSASPRLSISLFTEAVKLVRHRGPDAFSCF